MEDQFGGAKPGRGHRAIASLYRAGKVPGLITQNIDNLHQASGIAAKDIVELHGNTTYATCLDCGERYELPWVRKKFENGNRAPDCDCGGYIKTATGSSLVVWPAAGFPLTAKRAGATLVIINREPTDFDDLADLVVRDDIGDALGPFIAH
jgi:NAD-dependent deacetylase